MLAGLLNKKLILQEQTIIKNSDGSSSKDWTSFKTKKVSIKFLNGGEQDKDGIINYQLVEVLCWLDNSITFNHRFTDSYNQIYEIQAIQIIGLNEGMKIKCIIKHNN